MKSFAVLFLVSLAVFFQCEKKESVQANVNNSAVNQTPSNISKNAETPKPETGNNSNMKEVFNYSGKTDGIEYRFAGKLQKKGKSDGINYPNDNLVVEYTLKNTGAKDFAIYNQGHSDNENRAAVYVEPQTDGSIEISQKRFVEPKDKNCPLLDFPITPRSVILKGGQTISEKVFVEFPLENKTPFSMCVPQTPMPTALKKVKFCIGFAEADGQKRGETSEQKLLCSDEFSLE